MELVFPVDFLTTISLKCLGIMLDFGKWKKGVNCACIFCNSIAPHIKLCNFVRHFCYRLGNAATAVQAQMSEISGHEELLYPRS